MKHDLDRDDCEPTRWWDRITRCYAAQKMFGTWLLVRAEFCLGGFDLGLALDWGVMGPGVTFNLGFVSLIARKPLKLEYADGTQTEYV